MGQECDGKRENLKEAEMAFFQLGGSGARGDCHEENGSDGVEPRADSHGSWLECLPWPPLGCGVLCLRLKGSNIFRERMYRPLRS